MKKNPLGLISAVLGIIGLLMLLAGAGTWLLVSSQLSKENITVPQDAACAAGSKVAGPISAYCQADIINKHALTSTGGKTYAQLDQKDPLRATAMNGSFLRASLFTSVVSFGVALFAMGTGLVNLLLAWALSKVGKSLGHLEPAVADGPADRSSPATTRTTADSSSGSTSTGSSSTAVSKE